LLCKGGDAIGTNELPKDDDMQAHEVSISKLNFLLDDSQTELVFFGLSSSEGCATTSVALII
jgi:hypothetical protein